ncbi:MAG TPA: hypothetical protein VF179_29845 [Thermoanaerobaculia bacterium]|nr:hypothetical protein [Thermoanaerobaculia bacterium]
MMSKGFLLFLLAAFVLAGSPSVAEDLSFLTSTPASSCALMTSAAAPVLPASPLLTPQPESRVLVCGDCSDFACAGKRAYHGCSVGGELSYCKPDVECEGQTTVQCSCEPLQ